MFLLLVLCIHVYISPKGGQAFGFMDLPKNCTTDFDVCADIIRDVASGTWKTRNLCKCTNTRYCPLYKNDQAGNTLINSDGYLYQICKPPSKDESVPTCARSGIVSFRLVSYYHVHDGSGLERVGQPLCKCVKKALYRSAFWMAPNILDGAISEYACGEPRRCRKRQPCVKVYWTLDSKKSYARRGLGMKTICTCPSRTACPRPNFFSVHPPVKRMKKDSKGYYTTEYCT